MRGLIIALITGLLIAGWSRANYRRTPHSLSATEGNITPGKISAAIVTFFGTAIAIGGLIALAYGVLIPGLICLLTGAALALFMSPSLLHIHDVGWNAEGVSGPSSLFGPTLGSSRTNIRWADIVATGSTATSYWFIQSSDGRRIYWSYLYPGYGQLVESLKARLPNIPLPDDLN